jgi:hypothetical protein
LSRVVVDVSVLLELLPELLDLPGEILFYLLPSLKSLLANRYFSLLV